MEKNEQLTDNLDSNEFWIVGGLSLVDLYSCLNNICPQLSTTYQASRTVFFVTISDLCTLIMI